MVVNFVEPSGVVFEKTCIFREKLEDSHRLGGRRPVLYGW